MDSEKKPLVSVWMTTYNHEKYIAQAIESVVMQQTNFEFELLIGEDCSKDNTAAICKTYAEKYPDIIRLFSRTTNLGMMENGLATLDNARGKYVAIIEGDDYWTDPLKLQQQVDFLEANPDYIICFTRGMIKNEFTGVEEASASSDKTGEITFETMLRKNDQLTVTSLFYRQYVTNLPAWFKKSPFGDYALYLISLNRSGKKAYCLNSSTACYRLHGGGIHGYMHQSKESLAKAFQKELEFYQLVNDELLKGTHQATIASIFVDRHKQIASLLTASKQHYKGWLQLNRALRYGLGKKEFVLSSLKIAKAKLNVFS